MVTSNEYVRLGPTEILSDRPFTDPKRNTEDVTRLRYMMARLRCLLRQPECVPDRPEPIHLFLQEPGGRRHRVVILNRDELLAGREHSVVGFFGQKRPGADRSLVEVVDAELVDELQRHPDVLSYSSLELEDGNWSNMVLLADLGGIERWRMSARHIYAAREIAPRYYAAVRLQNGTLPAGLVPGGELILLRTKYYDFRSQRTWRAMRELERRVPGESTI